MKKLQKLLSEEENESLYRTKCVTCILVKKLGTLTKKLDHQFSQKEKLDFCFMIQIGCFSVYT